MKRVNILNVLLALLISGPVLFTSGCYNDSEEYLYPELPGSCDTANVTFSASIQPITDGYCKSCHSGSSPSGNVLLENYDQIKAIADDERFVNVINAANGYPLMPQGSALSECSIRTIEIWVAAGAPNN